MTAETINNQEASLIACENFSPSLKDLAKCISCGAKAIEHIPYGEDGRMEVRIRKSAVKQTFPIALGVPSTGLIRYEFMASMMQMSVPMCLSFRNIYRSLALYAPIGYHVAEARNLIVKDFLATDSEWLFFVDHDVLLPPMTYVFLLEHIRAKRYPIVSGLYCIKSNNYQPIVLRGRGAGAYTDFKYGDQVECDGIPMGCALIHRSILQYAYDNARDVRCSNGEITREVFRSPRDWITDPETGSAGLLVGTEDLWFCEKVISEEVYKKTGWEVYNKDYPFIVDTRIMCNHIGNDGQVWPKAWPETMRPI